MCKIFKENGLYISVECNLAITNFLDITFDLKSAEAAAQRCSVKKLSLEILENSQGNTCARAEICKNTFYYRTPLVAVSESGTYYPYRKQNNEILYVLKQSNHPSSIISKSHQKSKRVSDISCDSDHFNPQSAHWFLKFLKKSSQFCCTDLLQSSNLVHLDGKNLACFIENLVQNLMNLVLKVQ